MQNNFKEGIERGDVRALARFISLVENQWDGYREVLSQLAFKQVPLVGITGPPGAGKSTLINALAGQLLAQHKKVAVVAVDPTSPFNHGSLMGDRLRMSEHFLNPSLFIRSMASRGSLGGLAPRIFEVCDVLKAAGFDLIIIETVGVGQSEVEIAALADTTVLVLVPEAGDEIQSIKSGIMEIADVFVVNKADRDGADVFYKNLLSLAHTNATEFWEAPVVKAIASRQEGTSGLIKAITTHHGIPVNGGRKLHMLAQRALMMIKDLRASNIDMTILEEDLKTNLAHSNFNLYNYILKYV